MRYRVYLTATATVTASVEVEATTKAEAESTALAAPGDIEWSYDGLIDGTASVSGVDPTDIRPIPEGMARCDNCQRDTQVADLMPIKRASERLDCGGPRPAGECPACGALAYTAST